MVTARLRFRHLPPYFVRDLAERQGELGENVVPAGAAIDAEELLSHMVVGEIVTATSDEPGEQLGCPGPQNGELTILECVSEADIDDALEALGLAEDAGGGGGGDDREPIDPGDDEEQGFEGFVPDRRRQRPGPT